MSNSNGRIFIETRSGVTYGVEIADLQQVLGRGTGDLGLLCSDQEWYDNNGTPALRLVNKINKWAKYKPIRLNKLGLVTDSERLLENYGLTIPSAGYGSIDAMIADLPNADWTYLRPRGKGNGQGGSDEWFRLRDFEGYFHGAPAPLYPLADVSNTTAAEDTVSVGVGFGRTVSTDAGCLTLDDLRVDGHSISDTFSQFYFGIVLYNSSTYMYAATMPDTYGTIVATFSEIGLNVPDVAAPLGNGQTRTYRVIPFFSTVPFTSFPSQFNGTLFPLPFAECSVVVTRSTQVISPSVLMWTLSGQSNPLYYQYKIYNSYQTAWNNITLNIWALRSYDINDTYGSAVLSTTVSVPANDSIVSSQLQITDNLLITDILSNCPYVGIELRNGPRLAYAISSIIIDADPYDPPYL